MTEPLKANQLPQSFFALHTGIGRDSTHGGELLERARILEEYDQRARKGKGGTHLGKKKKKQEVS